MFNIIQRRKTWFTISGVLVTGSLIVIAVFGLKLGIDFTGGSLLELKTNTPWFSSGDIESLILENHPDLQEVKVQSSSTFTKASADKGHDQFIVRTAPLSESEHQSIITSLNTLDGGVEELRFESIGPTLGQELRDKAVTALLVATVVIIFYIAWSFRKVSEPVQSWKYGIGAIVALVHDVIIVTGIYALFIQFTSYQVDALFVTALLVILGYSVNDTIVVYDRVRENLMNRNGREDFEEIVNSSVNHTITRSINTSITTLLVLLTLFFFGGVSIRGFVLALMFGILIGTYSSIFLASPILVVWERLSKR